LISKNPNLNTNNNTLSFNSNNSTSLGSISNNKKQSKEITEGDFENIKLNMGNNNTNEENNPEEP